ncbi:MAG TPA: hypothetical protein VK943_15730 [Arenibaculum sp.]|nr:hypothetical protein [Arenibaculum sp.]
MDIVELQDRLRRSHAAMGGEGRLSFTIGQGENEPCYVTHWYRTGSTGFEDCRAVGVGTVDECLMALETYAVGYRRQPTREELGRMLGIGPAREDEREDGHEYYALAAE